MSQITIWNRALARLGDGANVSSPTENSRQAELCRQFYDSSRRSVLQMRDWSFASLNRPLSLAAAAPADPQWQTVYDYPADAIHVWAVFETPEPGTQHTASARLSGDPIYEHNEIAPNTDFCTGVGDNGEQVIYTNIEKASARFTVDVVDIGRWSPVFETALTWFLASEIAGPLIQGESGRTESRSMLNEFNLYMNSAATRDANQHRDTSMQRYYPSSLKAR